MADTTGDVLREEAGVPAYTLPPLTVDRDLWPRQRADLVAAFSHHVYGRAPQSGWECQRETGPRALAFGGLAVAEEHLLTIRSDRGERRATILLHRPAAADAPSPCFLGLNFRGNHTCVVGDFPRLPQAWVPKRSKEGVPGPQAADFERGCLARRWPMAELVAAGWAVATVYAGEFEPDQDGAATEGVRGLFAGFDGDHDWGCLAAWAWGLQRAREVVAGLDAIDAQRIWAIGHSRKGKVAILAAAQDEGFAGVVSNGSGCTGAALSRRRFGERLIHFNQSFPHWCCRAYHAFNEREDELPIDQHQLLAAIAPRSVLVCSAEGDWWADPRGEFEAARAASPAWEALGKPGLGTTDWPPMGHLVGGSIGYHLRPGEHDLTAVDWHAARRFAEAQTAGN